VRWHAHEDRDISPGCAVRPRSSRANGGAAAQVRRHLTLVCPQKPGLIKSITDLLKDHACTLIEVETSTFQKSGEIMFELSCLVDCPTSADAAELHSMIVWWTESQGNRHAGTAHAPRTPRARPAHALRTSPYVTHAHASRGLPARGKRMPRARRVLPALLAPLAMMTGLLRLEWSFNDNWQQHRVNAI